MCVSSCRHYFTSSGCKLTSVGSWTQHKLKRSQSCWSLHHFHQQFEILKAGIKRNSDDVSRVPAGWRAELVGSDFNIYTIFMSVSLAAARRRMWTWQHNKQAVKELLHCSASPLSTSSSSRVSSSRWYTNNHEDAGLPERVQKVLLLKPEAETHDDFCFYSFKT